jgi:transposase InsO family protein
MPGAYGRDALAEPVRGQLRGRLRDELQAAEAFSSLLEARTLLEDWRIEYTIGRPHSVIGYLIPTDFAKAGPPTTPNPDGGWTNNWIRSMQRRAAARLTDRSYESYERY